MGGPNGRSAPFSPATGSGPACTWPPWEDPSTPFAPISACNRPEDEDAFTMAEPAFTSALAQMEGLSTAAQRIECISRRFLGIAYLDDPLGEGDNDVIDTDPMFRFDGLDCMTFVEEVLALSESRGFEDFARTLQEIRYRDGVPLYGWRNHFVEADWIEENTRRGFIADITASVGGGLTQQASAVIDRARWVDQKPIGEDQKALAKRQLADAGRLAPGIATMEYIPIAAFFAVGPSRVEPNWELIGRLPEISILLMIRHEADAQRIGVIVAHMAFLIAPRMDDGTPLEPIIRHTSSLERIFKDEPLLPYLWSQEPYRAGVSILAIR